MASNQPYEIDSATTDSVASTPRSDHQPLERVRFMCSFGGKIIPRPSDSQLRYVGGDTRIVAFNRNTTFSALINKLSKLTGNIDISVKYQLPNEDLDSLISVTTDEDVENMMEEYDRFAQATNSRAAKLRLFLFNKAGDDSVSVASSISSLLEGSANRENWFVDALNGGAGNLERGRSEASSMVSEVPDYLFGLENSDDPKVKRKSGQDSVSVSDPNSPAPVVSTPPPPGSPAPVVPNSSTPPPMPDLPPVKTRPDNQVIGSSDSQGGYVAAKGEVTMGQATGYVNNNPAWEYRPDLYHPGHPVPPVYVYHVPGHGSGPVHQVPVQPQYVQHYPGVHPGHVVVGHGNMGSGSSNMYPGGARPIVAMNSYEVNARGVAHGVNQQQLYYGPGMVPGHLGNIVTAPEGVQGVDPNTGRVSQSGPMG